MPRLAAAMLVGLLTGCADRHLGQVSGGLAPPQAALAFPDTFVGYPTHQSLRLANTSAAPAEVVLDVPAPFQGPAKVELGPGARRSVELAFDPTGAGLQRATLKLTSGGRDFQVDLSGQAVAPPDCSRPPVCQSERFDPVAGRCEFATLPAETPCDPSNACLTDARCLDGQCVGSVRDCDDGDQCTADSCNPSQGCVHAPTTAGCPQPTEPCKVATCDPSWGCGISNAPDGTVCGSVSCAEAHLCFFGQCASVTPPDGFPCAPEGPCTGQGLCLAGKCSIQPETARVAWTYTPPLFNPNWVQGPWYRVDFQGVSDPEGNLYWLEWTYRPDSYVVVSMTADGSPRFRTGNLFTTEVYGLRLSLAHRVVLVSNPSWVCQSCVHNVRRVDGHLLGLSSADGGLVWSASEPVEFEPALLPLPDGGSPDHVVDWAGLVEGPGQLAYATLRRILWPSFDPITQQWFGGGEDLDLVLGLDSQTGQVLWSRPYLASFDSAIGDGAGNYLVSLTTPLPDGGSGDGWVVTISPDGGELSRVAVPAHTTLFSTFGTQVFANVPDAGAVSALIVPLPNPAGPDGGWLAGAPLSNGSWVLAPIQGDLLLGLDATASTPLAEWGWQPGALLLTSRGTAISVNDALTEFLPDGGQLYSCPLPVRDGGVLRSGPAALAGGRLVVGDGIGVTAYEVPGLDLAPHGWVVPGGTPGNAGHPR